MRSARSRTEDEVCLNNHVTVRDLGLACKKVEIVICSYDIVALIGLTVAGLCRRIMASVCLSRKL
jgi:hypothetical protein